MICGGFLSMPDFTIASEADQRLDLWQPTFEGLLIPLSSAQTGIN
jgi:hypothetical protein